MVDALPIIALAQLLPYETSHHDLHPLFPENGILGLFQSRGVFVVDSVKSGRNRGLLGQEGRRLRGGHVDLQAANEAGSTNSQDGCRVVGCRTSGVGIL